MNRVLLDTSIYVDWLRAGYHEELVAGRHGPPSLSAVVAMELLVGERRRHKRLAQWVQAFERLGRLLVPRWVSWRLAAHVLRQLRTRGLGDSTLTNDVLIAMTARVEGMRLFTTNADDFRRIARIEPFDLHIVS